MNEHLCARTLSQISNVVPYSSIICTCIIHKLLKRTLDHLCGALQQGFFGCCCHVNCQFNPRIAPRDNQRCTMYTILLWWSWWSINTVSSKIGNLGMSYYVLVHVFIVSILFLFFLWPQGGLLWSREIFKIPTLLYVLEAIRAIICYCTIFLFLEHCYHWSKKTPKKSFVNILLHL